MTSPETFPYPSNAELFAEVIAQKFRSPNNTLGETTVSSIRPGEDSMQIFPTTELPSEPNATNVILTQPQVDTENDQRVIKGPRLRFNTSTTLPGVHIEYEVLVHVRDGEIHERRHTKREGGRFDIMDVDNERIIFGVPVESNRAQAIIWWLEGSA